jgi:Zn-dependent peptidase ImmA (M78 family)
MESTTVPRLTTVSSLVEYLKATHGYDIFGVAPPVDVDKIAALLGIHVVESFSWAGPHADLVDATTVGMITLSEENGASVWINRSENSYPPRRRFTLAHEIGHFCMHRSGDEHCFVDNKKTMNRDQSYWDRSESEANSFAAELLMPEHLIVSVGGAVIDRYVSENRVETMPFDAFAVAMASKFNVSRPAMEYRLQKMGVGQH